MYSPTPRQREGRKAPAEALRPTRMTATEETPRTAPNAVGGPEGSASPRATSQTAEVLQREARSLLRNRVESSRLFAVDAHNVFYNVLAPEHHRHLVGGERVEDFLPNLVLEACVRFLRSHPDVLPLFILEGDAPSLKDEALATRRKQKEDALKRAREALARGETALARETSREAVRLPREAARRVVDALQGAGFPTFRAKGEAEAQGAVWARNRHAFCVATRDRDAFLFGAPRVCRKFPNAAAFLPAFVVASDVGAASWRDLMEAHVLAGATDYAPRAPNVLNVPHAVHLNKEVGFEEVLRQADADPTPWLRARNAYLQPLADADLSAVDNWGAAT